MDGQAEMELDHPPIVENDDSHIITMPTSLEDTVVATESERIAELLSHLPGCRSVLLEILEYCRTRQDENDIIALVDRTKERSHFVYSGLSLCRMLQKAGALDHERSDGAPFDEEALLPETIYEDGIDYIQATIPPKSFWQTTEAGIAALEEDDPSRRIMDIIADEMSYASIYKYVLERCQVGATGNELSDVIDSNPLVQNPRLYAIRFIKRLEDCGGIVWDGQWNTTDDGRASLVHLADIESL